MNFIRHLDRLAAALAALAGLLPRAACAGLWRPEAPGPLFARRREDGTTPVETWTALRIGAYGCRWAAAPKHDWPM
jgi:hypothetical protein